MEVYHEILQQLNGSCTITPPDCPQLLAVSTTLKDREYARIIVIYELFPYLYPVRITGEIRLRFSSRYRA